MMDRERKSSGNDVALKRSLGVIAAWGIESSVRIAAALTLIEAGGLVMIVVVAGGDLDTVPEQLPRIQLLR